MLMRHHPSEHNDSYKVQWPTGFLAHWGAKLRPDCIAVYLVAVQHAFEHGATPLLYQTIAELTGLHRNTVAKHLKRLHEFNLLTAERRSRKAGYVYHIGWVVQQKKRQLATQDERRQQLEDMRQQHSRELAALQEEHEREMAEQRTLYETELEMMKAEEAGLETRTAWELELMERREEYEVVDQAIYGSEPAYSPKLAVRQAA